jgi:hypothetical protein
MASPCAEVMRILLAASAACLWTLGPSDVLPMSLAQATPFSQRIPPADQEKYRSVRDATDWANPYLVVRSDGIEVISKTIPAGRKLVALGELREALIDLPTTAWPCGPVVAIQDVGLRGRYADKPIARNRKAAEDVLKALPVLINPWPSA